MVLQPQKKNKLRTLALSIGSSTQDNGSIALADRATVGLWSGSTRYQPRLLQDPYHLVDQWTDDYESRSASHPSEVTLEAIDLRHALLRVARVDKTVVPIMSLFATHIVSTAKHTELLSEEDKDLWTAVDVLRNVYLADLTPQVFKRVVNYAREMVGAPLDRDRVNAVVPAGVETCAQHRDFQAALEMTAA